MRKCPIGGAREARIDGFESGGEGRGEEAREAEARIFTRWRELIPVVFSLLQTSSVRVKDRLDEAWPARRSYVSELEGITGERAADAVERCDKMLVEWS